MKLLWFSGALGQPISCKAQASVQWRTPFFCCLLGYPTPVSCSVHQSGNSVAVCLEFRVWRVLPVLVCLRCSPFLFGCPGFVLTEGKFTDNNVEIVYYEREYSSQTGMTYVCLAFVKRVPRHSLYNLKAGIATHGQCEKTGR